MLQKAAMPEEPLFDPLPTHSLRRNSLNMPLVLLLGFGYPLVGCKGHCRSSGLRRGPIETFGSD